MTVNKLTYPAKENAVQEKINEIIDNLGASISVDQTYDGTSANPQSGVAIEGELSTNYQPKLVSGTNIKTINNTSLLGSGDISVLQNTATGTNALTLLGTATSSAYSINIGNLSSISGMNNIAIGSDVSVTGQGSTAIGSSSYVTANAAIQIGTGTNSTDYSLNVGFVGYGNYQLLNGATGLIPDARISSNIARTSAIPTQASDISAADTTLSNVSSIDSNSAVQTALDGKVSKSGDTMTGTLEANVDDNNRIAYKIGNVSTSAERDIQFYNTSANHRVGVIRAAMSSDGTMCGMTFGACNPNNDSPQGFSIQRTNSSVSCSFPNTTCVDGQWVNSYLSVASQESGTSSYSKDFSLSSYLPNDGKNYEVLLCCGGRTGTTTGNSIQIWLGSDIMATTLTAYGVTRTSNYFVTGGAVTLPVGTSRKITLALTSSGGTCSHVWVQAKGYRRIGTNS